MDNVTHALAGLLLVKSASSGVMLLAGTAVQAWRGIPADPAQVAGYAVVAAGGLAFGALYFRAARGPAPGRGAGVGDRPTAASPPPDGARAIPGA